MSARGRAAARPAALLFIAGEGGHFEQARRLLSLLEDDVADSARLLLLTDVERRTDRRFDRVLRVRNPSPKEAPPAWRDAWTYLREAVALVSELRRDYRVAAVVVTGPGFAVLPAWLLRAGGARLIVFETWSRFEARSKHGRLLYPMAHRFFVQHRELLSVYPKATWVGLL